MAGDERRIIVAASGRLGQQLGAGSGQQLAAEDQLVSPMAVGQETEVADALETRRKGVLQETPDELFGGNRHHLLGLLLVPVVFPGEGDLAVFQRQQAVVGDGHAMGIAPQVFEHVLRTTERRLSVNHPFALVQRRQIRGESGRVVQGFQIAEELELAGGVGRLQLFQKQAAEQTATSKRATACTAWAASVSPVALPPTAESYSRRPLTHDSKSG